MPNLELRPKLLALKPGTRIVSHDFSMDPWQPDEHVAMDAAARLDGSGGTSDIYLWRVPARVAGRWTWDFEVSGQQRRYELQLEQRFQMLSGTARADGRSVRIDSARLNGADLRLEFTVVVNGSRVKHVLDGKVDGDTVSGSASLSGDRIRSRRDWVARRTMRSADLTDVVEPTGYALRPQSMH